MSATQTMARVAAIVKALASYNIPLDGVCLELDREERDELADHCTSYMTSHMVYRFFSSDGTFRCMGIRIIQKPEQRL